jgi:D-glycero-alpha-D-manno-heptose 1-phosphate guanylyltransferase
LNSSENIELQSSPFRGRGGYAIILAGGLGTRLRSVVADIPKCMAPVAGKPFLHYVIEYLLSQGIDQFIFSVGYKSQMIIAYVNEQYPTIHAQFSVEEEPLGTGGAIKRACSLVNEENVLVLNGDTIFKADINTLLSFHLKSGSDCTLTLKPMQHFDRYGVVELNDDATISNFKEKQYYSSGLINGGVYVLKVPVFLQEPLPEKFSFEKDYLEAFVNKRKMHGIVQREYFIDIGIPEDYEKAQVELGTRLPDGQVGN